MRQLIIVTEQLEECKQLILHGGVPQLRMATLLADNVAEVLMHRRIEDLLVYSGWYENMLKRVLSYPKDPEREGLISKFKAEIIPEPRKKKIRRFFDEKVKFLSEEKKEIEPVLGSVLTCMHRYRNEAYHQDKLRNEIARPVALLLFEVVCDLFVDLGPKSLGVSSEENWKWFEQRYGVMPFDAANEAGRSAIRGHLRAGLPLSLEELRDNLLSHLNKRLESAYRALDFMIENVAKIKTRHDAMKFAQYWASRKDAQSPPSDEEYNKFVPLRSLADLEHWADELSVLEKMDSKLTVFGEFVRREEELEPIEAIIHDQAAELDHAIQMEIDRMRGK